MYKIQYSFFRKITLCCLLTTFILQAQTHVYNDVKIDSLTFANTRKELANISTEKFLKKVFKNTTTELPYRLLLPQQMDTGKKYPLVITFHNSTRIGTDNENQLEPLARIWLRDTVYNKFGCFVIAPQFKERSSNYINNSNGILTSEPSKDVSALLELIRNIEQEYPNIDKNRIYLVGYSMGASTAQNLMSITPEKFAAMVSVAAVPDFSGLNKIKNKNIWLIHGAQDTENPYKGSEALFQNLKNNKQLLFTTYTNLNHNNITIPLLLDDTIPKWLFEKKN
ncbi:phospholipase [Elizabethkingia meningoseptica]|uniref:carboxylesterase family protein n=1 Tax=Elizabethkingia meningoseptica TaxID=238 RepID=UPI0023B104C1|nr:PHB depolymerase family esterase [Elizabethkingia meningoseptica]MDE5468709.1 phospholipase [Elizabethkingia meningoseptica]MDE5476021.1 phospholipase [Elizabethkingia meningoseptica]MDE5478956.1 phospholipase [Elizabethkingia meningoseptica]MDE5484905.1 phospholipase [Elizabethkingia meningoseptica]MDE5502357.1 phospholipase [Elizabethkingia meningoseptica]